MHFPATFRYSRLIAFAAWAAASIGIAAAQAVPSPSPSALPPGPGRVLTNAKALAELRAANIVQAPLGVNPDRAVSAQDFARLLLRTFEIDPRKLFRVTTPAAPPGPLAIRTMQFLGFSVDAPSFARAGAPITREDAVSSALSAALSKRSLRAGPFPRKFPPFVDDADFRSADNRAVAHRAVFQGLVQIRPDNRFAPRAPLKYGDAAYLLDAIRNFVRSGRKG